MKYFLKNYCTMKYLGIWSPGLRTFFEKFVKPLSPRRSLPPSTYLMYAPLDFPLMVSVMAKTALCWMDSSFVEGPYKTITVDNKTYHESLSQEWLDGSCAKPANE